jgi:ABC-type multidrug transport system fused ATPase/permease subunit
MNTYRRMLHYLRPYVWPHMVLAVGLMLAFSAIESSVPFVIKFAIEQVSRSEPADLPLVVGLASWLTLLRGGGPVAGYLNDWIGQRVVTDLRNEVTAHLQELDLAFFNKQRAAGVRRVAGRPM